MVRLWEAWPGLMGGQGWSRSEVWRQKLWLESTQPSPRWLLERCGLQKGKDGGEQGQSQRAQNKGEDRGRARGHRTRGRAGSLLGASQSQQPLNSLQREAD